jgi:trans-aconitate methyltransferase
MSTRFPFISDEQWRRFVADIAETLELREGDRVFEVHCGPGAFLLPLYEAACFVGGTDPDARLIDIAQHDMPGGQWSVGDVRSIDASATWDVVIACSALDASWTLSTVAALLEKMVQKAAASVAILDVPSGLPFDERWFLRSLSALGVATVRLPALSIEGYETSGSRFNVIARLR